MIWRTLLQRNLLGLYFYYFLEFCSFLSFCTLGRFYGFCGLFYWLGLQLVSSFILLIYWIVLICMNFVILIRSCLLVLIPMFNKHIFFFSNCCDKLIPVVNLVELGIFLHQKLTNDLVVTKFYITYASIFLVSNIAQCFEILDTILAL